MGTPSSINRQVLRKLCAKFDTFVTSSLEYPSLAQDVFAYSLAKGLKLDEALKLRSESSWLLRPREEGLQTKKIMTKITIALRVRSCMLNIC